MQKVNRMVQTSSNEFRLDLDMLNAAVSRIMNKEYKYRQSGTTTAFLYLMMGEWFLGRRDAVYFYVAHNYTEARRVHKLFLRMLQYEEDAVRECTPHSIWCHNGQVFHFVGLHLKTEENTRGIDTDRMRVFIDVPYPFNKEWQYYNMIERLQVRKVEVIG